MKNPAEEIVTAWLQECKGYFTMNNIKVPKAKGGMGAEIDILGTDAQGNNIWVEVLVSTNPRRNFRKGILFKKTIEGALKDFKREDKRKKVAKYFKNKYEMWLVYGRLPLKEEDVKLFPEELLRHKVKPISFFGEIFKDMLNLKGFRLDAGRGYMNLFKTFHEP